MSAIMANTRSLLAARLFNHCLAHCTPDMAILLIVVNIGAKCRQKRANGLESGQNLCFAALMTVPTGQSLAVIAVANHDPYRYASGQSFDRCLKVR